jgi:hypothetical protein
VFTNPDSMHFVYYSVNFNKVNQLPPWSGTLLEELIETFPSFHGSPKFITTFTTARHWFLSRWDNSAHTLICCSPKMHFTIILPSKYCLAVQMESLTETTVSLVRTLETPTGPSEYKSRVIALSSYSKCILFDDAEVHRVALQF